VCQTAFENGSRAFFRNVVRHHKLDDRQIPKKEDHYIIYF